jgi:hypothetical protein
MISPADGAIIEPGASVQLTATATPGAGSNISKVEFFANGELIEQSTTPVNGQYSVSWNNVGRGRYELQAIATDSNGFITIARTVNVIVTHRSLVRMLSPMDGMSLHASADITMSADVSEAGLFGNVEFYANGVLVGEGNHSGGNQFSYTWHNAPDGFTL